MMKSRQSSYLLLLVIAIILAILLIVTNNKAITKHNQTNKQPDAYADNITVTRYDKFGKLATQLIAPKMTHYVDNNTSVFLKPKLTLYGDKQPWLITANQAQALNGSNMININGNVVIHENAGPNNPESTFITSTLTVNTQQQTAETNQPVHLTQKNKNGSTLDITAIGLIANQKTGEVQLLSHVRGYYVPAATTNEATPNNEKSN